MLAERIVRWRGPDDEAVCWQPVLDLGNKLRALERDRFARARQGHHFPGPLFRDYCTKYSVRALAAGRPTLVVPKPKRNRGIIHGFLARGGRVTMEDADVSVVVTSESASFSEASNSIILSAGSVTVKDGNQLVVICAGNFSAEKELGHSIIVARGSSECAERWVSALSSLAATFPSQRRYCWCIHHPFGRHRVDPKKNLYDQERHQERCQRRAVAIASEVLRGICFRHRPRCVQGRHAGYSGSSGQAVRQGGIGGRRPAGFARREKGSRYGICSSVAAHASGRRRKCRVGGATGRQDGSTAGSFTLMWRSLARTDNGNQT